MEKVDLFGCLPIRGYSWPVAARSARPEPPRRPLLVQVQYGDTLWTLAREYGDPGQDVREVVYQLQQANNLQGAELQAGQRLCIPVECRPPTA